MVFDSTNHTMDVCSFVVGVSIILPLPPGLHFPNHPSDESIEDATAKIDALVAKHSATRLSPGLEVVDAMAPPGAGSTQVGRFGSGGNGVESSCLAMCIVQPTVRATRPRSLLSKRTGDPDRLCPHRRHRGQRTCLPRNNRGAGLFSGI